MTPFVGRNELKQLWIELLREDCGIDGDNIERLQMETNELIRIFVTMTINTKRWNG
jgi:hypothetical protein